MVKGSTATDARSKGPGTHGFARLLLLPGALLALASAMPAQGQDIGDDLEQRIELSADDTGEDVARVVEDLSFRALRPLNINTATADELAAIPGLTPVVALKIILYRNAYGPFTSYDSLRAVDGVTEDAWRDARPFLTVGEAPPGHSTGDGEIEVVQRIGRRTTSEPDSTRSYAGGPARMYTRLSFLDARHVSANVTLDKDPGEAFHWNPATQTYGYDFLSAHLAIRDLGPIQTLVAGDFTLNIGQGLVLSSGNSFGKGGDPLTPAARGGTGLKPYHSSDEFRFFRGVGATVALSPFVRATLFGSQRKLDGSVEDGCETDPDARCVTRLARDGLHRSEGEINRKGTQSASVVGGALEYRNVSVQLGAAGYHNRFGLPLAAGTAPYERFELSGRQISAFSAYGRVYAHDILIYGEVAYSPQGSLGGIGGILLQLSERAQATVLARHYPASFVDLYGNGFGERSGAARNEIGFYTGLRIVPHRYWTLEGYFDQYRFPWLRFGVHRPATGYEVLARVTYEPGPRFNLSFQGRSETSEQGLEILDPHGRLLRSVGTETRRSTRVQVEYEASESVRLRARLEQSYYHNFEGGEQGLLMYQDARWQPSRKLRLDGRVTYFDTDGYASRLYAYENDVLYSFAVPALSGRGIRCYALASVRPVLGLMLQFKYGYTRVAQWDTDEPATPPVRDLNVLLRLTL